MKTHMVLRAVSLGMLLAAVIFVACALTNPQLGQTFCLFGFAIGAEIWRIFYAIYLLVMAALFLLSFLLKRP